MSNSHQYFCTFAQQYFRTKCHFESTRSNLFLLSRSLCLVIWPKYSFDPLIVLHAIPQTNFPLKRANNLFFFFSSTKHLSLSLSPLSTRESLSEQSEETVSPVDSATRVFFFDGTDIVSVVASIAFSFCLSKRTRGSRFSITIILF